MDEFIEALIRLNQATNNLLKPPANNALDKVVVHPMVIDHILRHYSVRHEDIRYRGSKISYVTFKGVDFAPAEMHYALLASDQ